MQSRSTLIATAVAAALASALAPTRATAQDTKAPASEEDVAELSDIEVTNDPLRVLPNEVSASSFGFSKSLLETPRAVSFVSEEQIELFGLSAVEDLVRLVPGTFTTTRYGIQGGIDVRNVPADTYLRGMKRLSLQGNGRTTLAAMDTIEVVKGPPSPIFGMGKIGGYTNMVPKSGRAKTGGYLPQPQGFAQAITGKYNRSETSFGVGGPMSVLGKTGGYYVYGLLEDSDSFTNAVPIEQDIFQVAASLDNFVGPFRFEAGFNTQKSRTAGALTSRVTQELVDTGRYLSGSPLVNLDANGNGSIGYLEMHAGSPVRGRISGNNTPLTQTFAWPRDSAGNPLPLDQFPVVQGIPQTLYNLLVDTCGGVTGTNANCPDPTGLLRAQGVGGPVPVSGQVPIGLALDPRTISYTTLDPHRATAFEREVRAQWNTAYIDLIYDVNPDFTMKNQLFYDNMNQHKFSNQGYSGGPIDTSVFEEKFTVTKRLANLPQWLQVNALASANFRLTRVETLRSSGGGDFSTNRIDAMSPYYVESLGGMTANTRFTSTFENSALNADGFPVGNHDRSRFWESGLGVMFDIDLFSKTNLIVGGRYDYSEAKAKTYAGGFLFNTGTSANPGTILATERTTRGQDTGVSYSISLSHKLPFNIQPYVTYAESSLSLDDSNNALSAGVIRAGHIGQANIKEVGIKTSQFDGKLFLTIAGFEQTRTNVASEDDAAILGAYATSTRTEGVEAEIKWVPTRNLFMSLFAQKLKTKYAPNLGGGQRVSARLLGFQDVVDPATGAVIFPAEAFLYGGHATLTLPAGMSQYDTKEGNPEIQVGLNGTYQLQNGLGFTFGGNWFDEVCTGRLCTIVLPDTYIANAGVYLDIKNWNLKFDVLNLFDESYFKPRTGDTLGEALLQAMPDRRWQATVKVSF
jgi:outer membrane receptor protein involved in Fe transport